MYIYCELRGEMKIRYGTKIFHFLIWKNSNYIYIYIYAWI